MHGQQRAIDCLQLGVRAGPQLKTGTLYAMTVKRMDNVGIVVEDIDVAVEFFAELGLELEGPP